MPDLSLAGILTKHSSGSWNDCSNVEGLDAGARSEVENSYTLQLFIVLNQITDNENETPQSLY